VGGGKSAQGFVCVASGRFGVLTGVGVGRVIFGGYVVCGCGGEGRLCFWVVLSHVRWRFGGFVVGLCCGGFVRVGVCESAVARGGRGFCVGGVG